MDKINNSPMSLTRNSQNSPQTSNNSNQVEILQKFYNSFSHLILTIYIFSINGHLIDYNINPDNGSIDIFVDTQNNAINLDKFISDEKNKKIFDQMNFQNTSIFKIKFDKEKKIIEIQRKNITFNSEKTKVLRSNLSKLIYVYEYFFLKSLIDSISYNNISNPDRAKRKLIADEYVKIAFNFQKPIEELRYSEKRQILDLKKSFYQQIITELKQIVQQIQPIKEKISSYFLFSSQMINFQKNIDEIKNQHTNSQSIVDMRNLNISFKTQIINHFDILYSSLQSKLNSNQKILFDLLKQKIQNILNGNDIEIFYPNSREKFIIKDYNGNDIKLNTKDFEKFKNIISNFQNFIKNILYNGNFNNKIIEQNDQISQSIQDNIKNTIKKIEKLKFYKSLFNLINDEKFFGYEVKNLNYHTIFNIYKNPNSDFFNQFIQFAENITNISYISNLIEQFLQTNEINDEFELKNFFLKDLLLLEYQVSSTYQIGTVES
jgi:hypothetical protein